MISIIIPTYNRVKLLKKSLEFILHSKNVKPDNYEIIIIDDGSSDTTKQICGYYTAKFSNIKYFGFEKNSKFNVSKIRNFGSTLATGDILVFIDCGIAISDNFIANTLEISRDKNSVILYKIYGFNISLYDFEAKKARNLTPMNLNAYYDTFKTHEKWVDHRERLLSKYTNLKYLPAPWVLGWSGAISIPKSAFEDVRGFDESFNGWGSEDTDLCFRLYKNNLKFRYDENSYVVHLPHSTSINSTKHESNFKNRIKLHEKHFDFETELYPYFNGLYYNNILISLNNIDLGNLVPDWNNQIINYLCNEIGSYNGNVLLSGVDNINVIKQLKPNNVLIINKYLYNLFLNRIDYVKFNRNFGCHTHFDSSKFNLSILSNFIMYFNNKIFDSVIKESLRIANKLYIVIPKNYQPIIYSGITSSDQDFHDCVSKKITYLKNNFINYSKIDFDEYTIISIQ